MLDSSSLGFLAKAAMVIGAPLVYADQAYSIARRRNSEGFSKDVCAVLLIANIARVFWWLRVKFELALLLQSLLMIASQLGLLSLILRFQPGSFASSAYTASSEDYRNGHQGPPPSSVRSARPQPGPQITVEPPTPTQTSAELPNVAAAQPDASPSAEYASPGLRALFGSIGGSSRGNYVPVLGDFRFPTMPTLDTSGGFARLDDEAGAEEEDTEPVSLPTRLGRQALTQTRGIGRQLKVLLGVRNDGSLRKDGSSSSRPFGFWTWRHFHSYILFLVAFSILLTLLHFVLGTSSGYSFALGLFALGLESALPVPQFLSNQRRRSLAGFRISVLGGWLLGDAFKTVYFLVNNSPIQFIGGGCFALGVDLGIVAQAYYFQEQTQRDEEEERQADAGRAAENASAGNSPDGRPDGRPRVSPSSGSRTASSRGVTLATQAAAASKGAARSSPLGSGPASPWTAEHADLDDDPIVFDASGTGPEGKHQMFTIEADDD
ncbi:unnamed protein product [Parajaminaea phylloscopi]